MLLTQEKIRFCDEIVYKLEEARYNDADHVYISRLAFRLLDEHYKKLMEIKNGQNNNRS